MQPMCQRCGRSIPRRRIENGLRVGRETRFCSSRCQTAAKQARHRAKAPSTAQDRIHLRNLVAHGMIAEKLLRDPSVLLTTRENLERWAEQSGAATAAIREWAKLIEADDSEAIAAALLNVDEDGMRLRSSSPFTGILTDVERRLVFQATRKSSA